MCSRSRSFSLGKPKWNPLCLQGWHPAAAPNTVTPAVVSSSSECPPVPRACRHLPSPSTPKAPSPLLHPEAPAGAHPQPPPHLPGEHCPAPGHWLLGPPSPEMPHLTLLCKRPPQTPGSADLSSSGSHNPHPVWQGPSSPSSLTQDPASAGACHHLLEVNSPQPFAFLPFLNSSRCRRKT